MVVVSSEVDVAISAAVVVVSAALFTVVILSVFVIVFVQSDIDGFGGPHSRKQVLRSLSKREHFFVSVSYTE